MLIVLINLTIITSFSLKIFHYRNINLPYYAIKPKGSGIYEYTGPSLGNNPPPEIAAMFDLSKGRKVRKGSGFGKRKSSFSKYDTKERKSDDSLFSKNENFDIVELEKQVAKKYGSRIVKESTLEKEDINSQQLSVNRRNKKFEGFGKQSQRSTIEKDNDLIEPELLESRTMNKFGKAVPAASKRHWEVCEDPETGQSIVKLDEVKKMETSSSRSLSLAPIRSSHNNNADLFRTQSFKGFGKTSNEKSNDVIEGYARRKSMNDIERIENRIRSDLVDVKWKVKSNSGKKGATIKPFFKDDDTTLFEDDDKSDDDFYDEDEEDDYFEQSTKYKSDQVNIKSKSNNRMVSQSIQDIDQPPVNKKSTPSTQSTQKSSTSIELVAPTPIFRLRSPAHILPLSPQQIEANRKKEEMLIKLNEKKKKLSTEKKISDKQQFVRFDFEDGDASIIVEKAQSLFSSTDFKDLGITNPKVLSNLEKMNIAQPTRIQELAIPTLMNGEDAIMQAHTGSGKTLAFLLPLIRTVDPSKRKIQAIVLASSRELVSQIGMVADKLFEGAGIISQTIIGGANVLNQIKKMKSDRPQVVIATPGRLAELVFKLERVKLGMVRSVIIDEADQLLCEPYIDELTTILDSMPLFRRTSTHSTLNKLHNNQKSEDLNSDKETVVSENDDDDDDFMDEKRSEVNDSKSLLSYVCLASATSTNNEDVKKFATKYLRLGWKIIAMDNTRLLPPSITHGLISTPRIRALEMLRKLLNSRPVVNSAIIFVNDPHRVEVVCEKLMEMNLVAAPLHGDSSKDDRKEILTRIRDGRLRLVVSTELAARGLDIPELTHVINFDLPTDSQHYVHRAGRCGRVGRQGLVMNFANPETKFVVRRFGKQLGVKVQDCEIRDGQVYLKVK